MSDQTNPSNENPVAEVPHDYIPMSVPTLRLQVPAKPGFFRYWFRGDAARIQRAMQAGYKFVDQSEVNVNNFDLGGNASNSGSTDMGSRVSVTSGDETDSNGNPNRLYLMEIPNHLYEKGQEYLTHRNDEVAKALRSGLLGADGEDTTDKKARYSKSGVPDLFNPVKTRRR